jgi:predicted nucleic-acid-binding protein
MKVALDTNVLVRALMADDEAQSRIAMTYIDQPELVAISTHSLCELVWVLKSGYDVARGDIAAAVRMLMETENVAIDRPAIEAGLTVLEAGGDFTDGVIDYQGAWLGGEMFVTFDKKAVAILTRLDRPAHLLTGDKA